MSTPVHKNIKITKRNISTLIIIYKNYVEAHMSDDYIDSVS